MVSKSNEYDVALSFAGENRDYVVQVAEILRAADISVFFDDFETSDLWGRDLAVHFDEVYRRKAKYVVPFISRHYAEKAWPRHEFQSALARAVEARETYLLPVRFDGTELPGLRPTIMYLDASQLAPAEVAQRILEKLGRPNEPSALSVGRPGTPRLKPSDFNPYAEAEIAIATLAKQLAAKAETLRGLGYGVHAREHGPEFKLRVMRDGRTLYSLDVWIGRDWGENTLCFYGARGAGSSPGATNAHGTIEWARDRGQAVVKLMNMSLLQKMATDYVFTTQELAEAIWEVVVAALEEGE
jgi:hypothetical protein